MSVAVCNRGTTAAVQRAENGDFEIGDHPVDYGKESPVPDCKTLEF